MITVASMEFTTTCEHRHCDEAATFAVWTSHHAVECRDAMGFRCAQHTAEVRAYWRDVRGEEMRCGCVIEGRLSDHFRSLPL